VQARGHHAGGRQGRLKHAFHARLTLAHPLIEIAHIELVIVRICEQLPYAPSPAGRGSWRGFATHALRRQSSKPLASGAVDRRGMGLHTTAFISEKSFSLFY
jgi:hypothetical protein